MSSSTFQPGCPQRLRCEPDTFPWSNCVEAHPPAPLAPAAAPPAPPTAPPTAPLAPAAAPAAPLAAAPPAPPTAAPLAAAPPANLVVDIASLVLDVIDAIQSRSLTKPQLLLILHAIGEIGTQVEADAVAGGCWPWSKASTPPAPAPPTSAPAPAPAPSPAPPAPIAPAQPTVQQRSRSVVQSASTSSAAPGLGSAAVGPVATGPAAATGRVTAAISTADIAVEISDLVTAILAAIQAHSLTDKQSRIILNSILAVGVQLEADAVAGGCWPWSKKVSAAAAAAAPSLQS